MGYNSIRLDRLRYHGLRMHRILAQFLGTVLEVTPTSHDSVLFVYNFGRGSETKSGIAQSHVGKYAILQKRVEWVSIF